MPCSDDERWCFLFADDLLLELTTISDANLSSCGTSLPYLDQVTHLGHYSKPLGRLCSVIGNVNTIRSYCGCVNGLIIHDY